MQQLVMQVPAGIEWIIIAIVAVVILFGVKKIPELARTFGRASGEYQKARVEAERELAELRKQVNLPREKLEEIARTLGLDYVNKADSDLKIAIEGALKKKEL